MKAITKQRVPPLSVEAQQVIARLRKAEIGDIVSWDELEALTNRPRDTVRQLARTARKHLMKEVAMHFQTCPSVGVERIAHTTVTRVVVPGQRKRIAGAARRMEATTRHVILDELNQDDRNQLLIHQTLAALTQHACATNGGVKQLSKALNKERQLSPFTPREAAMRLFSE